MKSLKCRYCSAMFASRQGRIKHSKKNHPEYNIRMDELNSRKTHVSSRLFFEIICTYDSCWEVGLLKTTPLSWIFELINRTGS